MFCIPRMKKIRQTFVHLTALFLIAVLTLLSPQMASGQVVTHYYGEHTGVGGYKAGYNEIGATLDADVWIDIAEGRATEYQKLYDISAENRQEQSSSAVLNGMTNAINTAMYGYMIDAESVLDGYLGPHLGWTVELAAPHLISFFFNQVTGELLGGVFLLEQYFTTTITLMNAINSGWSDIKLSQCLAGTGGSFDGWGAHAVERMQNMLYPPADQISWDPDDPVIATSRDLYSLQYEQQNLIEILYYQWTDLNGQLIELSDAELRMRIGDLTKNLKDQERLLGRLLGLEAFTSSDVSLDFVESQITIGGCVDLSDAEDPVTISYRDRATDEQVFIHDTKNTREAAEAQSKNYLDMFRAALSQHYGTVRAQINRLKLAAAAVHRVTGAGADSWDPVLFGSKILWKDFGNGSTSPVYYQRDIGQDGFFGTADDSGNQQITESTWNWILANPFYQAHINKAEYNGQSVATGASDACGSVYSDIVVDSNSTESDGSPLILLDESQQSVTARLTADCSDQVQAAIWGDNIVWVDRRNGNRDVYFAQINRPYLEDSDGDGKPDYVDISSLTSQFNDQDDDNDGINDAVEIAAGSNPWDHLSNPDSDPPTLVNVPADFSVDATSAAGAVVTYAAPTAEDTVDPAPTVSCIPASGTTFPLGVTTVTCTTTDYFNNSRNGSFTVTVQDRFSPVLNNLPADILAEATGPAGRVVTYTLPGATDIIDPTPTVVCTPPSGSTFPIGATVVFCDASDDSGNTTSGWFTVNIRDTTPPTIADGDLTVEATSSAGRSVTYIPPSVTDLVDPSPTLNCIAPIGGSVVTVGTGNSVTFPIGITSVRCTATDFKGNSHVEHFDVTVQDTTPPLMVLSDIIIEATRLQVLQGAWLEFSFPVADAVDPTPTVICSPYSGEIFVAKDNTVTVNCTARDDSFNESTGSFTATVLDTTPPFLVNIPEHIIVEATGPDGAVVHYTPPGAEDIVDPSPTVECTPPSGSTFPLLGTGVVCTATDDSGNSSSLEAFRVLVQDTTPPVLSGMPSDIVLEATSPDGAVYYYPFPTATDIVGPVSVACSIARGGIWPIGINTATCQATDGARNTTSASFTITVQDTTPPVISGMPSDVVLEATGPGGAVYHYAAPTITDNIGLASFGCYIPPQALWPIGINTATCTAVDTSGNRTSASFFVTVQDTTAPVVTAPPDLTVQSPDGSAVSVTLGAATATDIVNTVIATPSQSGPFLPGEYTIIWSATDNAGNTGSDQQSLTVNSPYEQYGVPLPGGGSVDVLTGSGNTLQNVSVSTSTPTVPGVDFIIGTNPPTSLGTLSYEVTLPVSGGSATTTVVFDTLLPQNLSLFKVDTSGTSSVIPSAGQDAQWSRSDDVVANTTTFTVTIVDGGAFDLDNATNGTVIDPLAIGYIFNYPPTADGGVDESVPCIDLSCTVILDGSGSTDPEGAADIIRYAWYENHGDPGQRELGAGALLEVNLPLGDHLITLEVEDTVGHIATDTFTVTVRPEALSLFEIKKVEVEWDKQTVKVQGKVALPVGKTHFEVTPEGSVTMGLSDLGAVLNEAVVFEVKGADGKKWEYQNNAAATGITKFNINWKGSKFDYNQDIQIKSGHIGQDSTTLEINRKEVLDSFTVTIEGSTTVIISVAEGVDVFPPGLEVDIDDDGEIEIVLPFALTPDMVITISGALADTFLVSDYYSAAVGKFQMKALFGSGGTTGDVRPATLDVGVTLGDVGFPGDFGIVESDWSKLNVNEWKYKK